MGLIWLVGAVIAVCVGIVWLAEFRRRRGFVRSLPRDLSRRARRDALHTERLRSAHVREINGVRSGADRRNVGGAG